MGMVFTLTGFVTVQADNQTQATGSSPAIYQVITAHLPAEKAKTAAVAQAQIESALYSAQKQACLSSCKQQWILPGILQEKEGPYSGHTETAYGSKKSVWIYSMKRKLPENSCISGTGHTNALQNVLPKWMTVTISRGNNNDGIASND
ncbi:MAG: hypothetical protein V3W04_04610 [Gammaproteobacteria bacterium]